MAAKTNPRPLTHEAIATVEVDLATIAEALEDLRVRRGELEEEFRTLKRAFAKRSHLVAAAKKLGELTEEQAAALREYLDD